jgi:CRP-like cAMP-binding protein
MTRLAFAPGEVVIRKGEPGDRFYPVDDGEVEVSVWRR